MMVSERREIQSLARGLDLMVMLADSDRPLGITEIARNLHLDKSTVFRLLSTLAGRGFIVQEPETRRYKPGLQIVALSRKVLDRTELRSIVKPFLKQLQQNTGETAHLALFTGNRAVYIDREDTDASLNVQTEIGQEAPLHCTAIGKALIAHLSQDELEKILENRELTRFTSRTITTIRELIPHLQTANERGYTLDDEEYHPGVRCISAPIRDHRNIVVAAIGISGPSIRVTPDKIPDMASVVMDTANQISQLIKQS
jgi:IclR family transcriptional regulator, KDG regulon repressor